MSSEASRSSLEDSGLVNRVQDLWKTCDLLVYQLMARQNTLGHLKKLMWLCVGSCILLYLEDEMNLDCVHQMSSKYVIQMTKCHLGIW